MERALLSLTSDDEFHQKISQKEANIVVCSSHTTNTLFQGPIHILTLVPAIVKLFCRFQNQEEEDPWAIATGWLIRPDLLVTAGHCAFDWSHDLGCLREMKAYIGYAGKDSTDDDSVQFRMGKRVATTLGWLQSNHNKANDVSFVQLDKPFTGVTPFKYAETPKQGSEVLGVVGYPGDKKNWSTNEKGAYMFEMFQSTDFDLDTAENGNKMLEYRVSTFGGKYHINKLIDKLHADEQPGNSGSPVLRKDDLVSIGAHVYGGDPNSASVIGRNGNPYKDYVATFDKSFPKAAAPPGIQSFPGLNFAQVPTDKKLSNGEASFDDGQDEEADFLDFVKKAIGIGAPIAKEVLKEALPVFLGPVGAPLGALAGLLLSATGKTAESLTGAESDTGKPIKLNGVAERALLGEAAFQAVMSMGKDKLEEEGFLEDMMKTVNTLRPIVEKVAPRIAPILTEPALRIALDTINKVSKPKAESGGDFPVRRNIKRTESSFTRADRQTEAFMEALMGPTTLDPTGEEGFFGDLGNIITSGLTAIPNIIGTVVEKGLPVLIGALTESEFDAPDAASSFDGAFNRALVGEAALQTLIKQPVSKLEEEGLFDIMKGVLQRVGPAVIKSAPGIIKAVTPLVNDLLGKTESGGLPQPKTNSFKTKAFKSQPSLGDLLAGTNFDEEGPKVKTKSKMSDVNVSRGYVKGSRIVRMHSNESNRDGVLFENRGDLDEET